MLVTQGAVQLAGAVLSLAVASTFVEVTAYHGLLCLLGIALVSVLEAALAPGRKRLQRDAIRAAGPVERVREEPMRTHLVKAAGLLVTVVCLLTLGLVVFSGFGTGFGIVTAVVAANGARDLWIARWLASWERDGGRRLLQDSGWPLPGRRAYYLQPLGLKAPA